MRTVDGRRWTVAVLLSSIVYLPPSTVLGQGIDPTGHWRTLQSEHFNIHVREAYRALGPRVAAEAEAAWRELSAVLPAPTRRVELVLADNTDEANGYATTYPLPQVVVYAIPPAGDVALEAYDRWLRLVVTHELAHIFHLDLARGWWRLGRSVLGRAPFLFPNEFAPPWIREGVAVFYESKLTGAGRLDAAYHNSIVNASASEAGALPLDAINTPTPKWPAGIRAYAFGSAFFLRASERYGDSVVATFAREAASRAFPYVQISQAWKRATLQSLGAEWREAPWGRGGDGRGGAGTGREGTRGEGDVFAALRVTDPARVSPGGHFVAFAHNDGRDATWLMVLDRRAKAEDSTTAWRRVARLNGSHGIAWMHDGRVLVSQMEFSDARTIRSDLWAIDRNGRSERLTFDERLTDPDEAPDGRIVAVRTVPGSNELVELQWPGGQVARWPRVRVLVPAEPGVEWAQPRYSPGGDTIAVVRVERGWHDIRLLRRDGSLVRDLTHDSIADLAPAFTADGRTVTWSREFRGVPQIVGVTGDEPISLLTDEPFAAYAPEPAPGDSLFYLAYHADGYHLVATPLRARSSLLAAPFSEHAPEAVPPEPGIRERDYSIFPSILPHYWLPQVFVQAGGTWLGALSSGSDVLGRHQWAASLMAGVGALRRQVASTLLYHFDGIRNVEVDASWSHHPELYVGATNTPGGPVLLGTTCCDPNDALRAGITMTRRRWRSTASARVGVEATTDGLVSRRGASIGASYGNLVGAPLGISPQDGWRVAASARYRERTGSGLHATEYLLRGTLYQSSNSPSFARQVFALRASAGLVAGNDNIEYSIGGVSSEGFALLPGIALGGGLRNFQVRGYAPGVITGRRALGVSAENRVPLRLVDRGIGMLPVGLDRLSATLFTDGAVGWAATHCPTFVPSAPNQRLCPTWLWSVGGELVFDLGLGYELPLRVRAGGALRITDNGNPGAWVAIGSAF